MPPRLLLPILLLSTLAGCDAVSGPEPQPEPQPDPSPAPVLSVAPPAGFPLAPFDEPLVFTVTSTSSDEPTPVVAYAVSYDRDGARADSVAAGAEIPGGSSEAHVTLTLPDAMWAQSLMCDSACLLTGVVTSGGEPLLARTPLAPDLRAYLQLVPGNRWIYRDTEHYRRTTPRSNSRCIPTQTHREGETIFEVTEAPEPSAASGRYRLIKTSTGETTTAQLDNPDVPPEAPCDDATVAFATADTLTVSRDQGRYGSLPPIHYFDLIPAWDGASITDDTLRIDQPFHLITLVKNVGLVHYEDTLACFLDVRCTSYLRTLTLERFEPAG